MTAGARATADRIIPETRRVTLVDGVQEVRYVEPRNAVFPFEPPVGPLTMVAPVPHYETITAPASSAGTTCGAGPRCCRWRWRSP